MVHRPPRTITQGLKPVLLVAVENLVAGLAGTKPGVAAAYAGWKGLGLLGCTSAAVAAIAQGCARLFQWYKTVK
jgi:hypothetical protein